MKQEAIQTEAGAALAALQQGLVELQAELSSRSEECSAISECIDKARRAIEQFESGSEVIACIGMLKAGKSTLVNLLTRSPNASPMGYGQDTTLRPVIIRMAGPGQEGRLLIYDAPTGSDSGASVRLVMDHLRGLNGVSVPEGLRLRVLPLSNELLTTALCTQPAAENKVLPQEPVMVVVETEYEPDCVLLRERSRMLLDMPGCDSPNAAVVRSNLYREIGKECDMALILQSSVAPLNELAVELLGSLLGSRSASTFRIIQNRMEAKQWLKPEVLAAQDEGQKKNARRVFSVLSGNRSMQVDSVNLGLAYAGIFEQPERLQLPVHMPGGVYDTQQALREASGFCAMESDLNHALPGIRYAHCLDELRRALQELREAVEVHANALQGQLDALMAENEALRTFGREVLELLKPASLPQESAFSFAVGADLPDFSRIAADTAKGWKNGRLSREEVDGSEVNECLDACNTACRDALLAYLNAGIRMRKLNLQGSHGTESLDRYCDDVLIRNAVDTGLEKLDATRHDMLARFPRAVHPRHAESLRDSCVLLPLPESDYAPLCRYERMRETERLWEYLPINVSKTYLGVLSSEIFLSRLQCLASHYGSLLEAMPRQYPPYKAVNDAVQMAVERATAPLHAAVSAELHANTTRRKILEKQQQYLNDVQKRVCEWEKLI